MELLYGIRKFRIPETKNSGFIEFTDLRSMEPKNLKQ